MKTRITLVPTGGLCNRMVSIMNAILVSKDNDIEFDVRWWKNKECFAAFSELFLPIANNKVKVSQLSRFYHQPALKRNLFLPSLLRRFIFDKQYSRADHTYNMTIEDIIGNDTNIYISTFTRFSLCTPPHGIASVFNPTPEIEEKISSVTQRFDSRTIGVHIRRTDNIPSIKHDTIDRYLRLMDKEISQNADCKFYIASDDEQVKKEMKEKYGNRIITQQWELSRGSVQGMKDAVAELFCLGRCNKVIGSKYSTYSIYAARLYDIPLITTDEA